MPQKLDAAKEASIMLLHTQGFHATAVKVKMCRYRRSVRADPRKRMVLYWLQKGLATGVRPGKVIRAIRRAKILWGIEKMNLGKLLLLATGQPAPEGNISGVCVVCASETGRDISLKKAVSDNFTGWSRFFSGNCMCPECAFLFFDQIFRKKS